MLEDVTEAEVHLRKQRGQGKSDHSTHTPALSTSWPGLHTPHPSWSFYYPRFIEWETEARRS